MANDLEKKIVTQIEYYFGDINLPRDKFLQEKVKEDNGWVAIDVLLTFNRLAKLTTDKSVIAEAIEKSELVEVSEDKLKLRRSPGQPLPEDNEARKKELLGRTAYAKGFPLDSELNDIVTFLEPHGPVDSCQRRTYVDSIDKKRNFKGSCFIIFKKLADCTKFVEAESIKYGETELIRKFRADYDEEKMKEREERKNKKKNKAEKQQENDADNKDNKDIKVTIGAVTFFSGVKLEHPITREDIKEKVEEKLPQKLIYIDYSKGLTEGHLRFRGENDAVEFHKLLDDGKLTVGENELEFRVVEGQELTDYYINVEKEKKQFKRNKQTSKFGKKRKGNFRNGGPPNKIKNKSE